MHMQLVKTGGLSGQQMVTFFLRCIFDLVTEKESPPHPSRLWPPRLRPLGLFWCWKWELIVVQARWQWGLHHHPAPHPIFLPSDHFKGPTGNRHIEKNLELPLSVACEIFLRAIEVSRGKKRPLFSRNISWPPRLWGVAAQHRFFFIAVFFSSGHWSAASPLRDLSPPSVSHLLFITLSSFCRAMARLTSRWSFFCFEMYESGPALLLL